MVFLSTSIEIAAAPEKVRAVLLDFSQTSAWLHGPGITSISIKQQQQQQQQQPHPTDCTSTSNTKTPTKPNPNPADPYTLSPGDIVVTELNHTTKFSPVILVNTPEELQWQGRIPYYFHGKTFVSVSEE
ncbi:hypothetical protein BST61_g420 [Cercospora zeina]